MTYGKLFESLFTGSMIGGGPVLFAVWTYCIANSKPPGLVEVNSTLVATQIGCTKDEIEKALATLCEPDANSRTPDESGCRLVQEGHYLYRMPTWPKYNAIRREVDRREQNRRAQKTWRDKQKSKDKQSAYDRLCISHGKPDKPTEMYIEKASAVAPKGQQQNKSEAKPRKGRAIACPASCSPDLWKGWCETRRAKKAPQPSATVWKLFVAEVMKAGCSIDMALTHCITRNWVSFKADWIKSPWQKPEGQSHATTSVNHNTDVEWGDPSCLCSTCKHHRRS